MAIGEIISAGVGLIGSLFGKKKQTTTSTVDYSKMADEAHIAGFNPLTALRNGGSAGFTTTTSPTISQTPELLANLGGVLGNALGNKLDPIEAKKREIDTLLVDRQLQSLKQGPARQWTQNSTFNGVKVSQQLAPRVGVSGVKKAASVPAAYDLGNPNAYEQSDAKKMNYGNQNVWKSNPWLPAAETIEDDFGDVAGSVYGAPKAVVDIGYNLGRWGLMAKDAYVKAKKRELARPQPKYIPPEAARLGGWAARGRPCPSGGGGW